MIGAAWIAAWLMAAGPVAGDAIQLPVPILRQERERCGPAALLMVFRYYRGDSAPLAAAERAYDPVLRGSLVTALAEAAQAAGFAAEVAKPAPDSLIALLRSGVPPILLFVSGPAALGRQHYGVLVGWDPARSQWRLHDGGSRERRMAHDQLLERWRAAGGLAVVVRDVAP